MSSFIREVQLFIGPLTQKDNNKDLTQALVIKSSGKNTEQRLSFKVQKNSMGNPSLSSITVYNLSSDTRQIIAKAGTAINLQVGYQQGGVGLLTLAAGSVASTISERDGAEIKTTINSFDGLDGLAFGKFNRSYKNQVLLSKIVEDIAVSLPGITIQTNSVDLGNQKIGRKGAVLTGRSYNLLNNLAHQWGFSWFTEQGLFRAQFDTNTDGNVYDISTIAGNLIHATPRIDNVLQTVTGVEIVAVLDPRIQPFDNVKLTSTVTPSLNNTYKVTNIEFVGDTHGDSWVCVIQCLFTLGQILDRSSGN